MSGTGGEEIGLIYVSTSTLRLPGQAGEIDAIVNWSRDRNRTIEVTGALVFTEKLFSQYLEGSAERVDTLMNSIVRDPRHRDIDVLVRRPIAQRRFATWQMAYAGPSTFVAGHVLAAAEANGPAARTKYADRLIDIMSQFAEAQLIEQRRKHGG